MLRLLGGAYNISSLHDLGVFIELIPMGAFFHHLARLAISGIGELIAPMNQF
jgi:hypothetical protein